MKIAVAVAAVGFAVAGLAIPADQCQDYKTGKTSCYTATVTAAEVGFCPYKACPGLQGCHAEWLMATTTKVIPCKNRCCPTTATTTATTPCGSCPKTCTPMYTETLYRYGSECQPTEAPPKGPNAAQLAAVEAAAPTPTLRPIEQEYDYIRDAELRVLQEKLREKDSVIEKYRAQERLDNIAKELGFYGRQQVDANRNQWKQKMIEKNRFWKREMPPLTLNPDGSVETPPPHPFGPGGQRPAPADEAAVETTATTPTPTHGAPDGNLRCPDEGQRGDGYWTEDPFERPEYWRPIIKKPEDAEKTEADIEIESMLRVNYHNRHGEVAAELAAEEPTLVSKDGETPTESGPFEELFSLRPGFGHGPAKSSWRFTGWPKPPTIEPLPPILNPPHNLAGGGGTPGGKAAEIEAVENALVETNAPLPMNGDNTGLVPEPQYTPPKTMSPPPGVTMHTTHHKPDTKPEAWDVADWNPKFGHGPIDTSPDYDGPIIEPPVKPWPPKTHQWPAEGKAEANAEVGLDAAAENENATPTDHGLPSEGDDAPKTTEGDVKKSGADDKPKDAVARR